MTNKRTDEHRPSAISPDDYQYVAMELVRIDGLGDCLFLQTQRERIRAHMARTGGTYAGHEHGGNCMVCGSVNAVYTALFYHEKSNTYVRMGTDCAMKCEMGGTAQMNAFIRAAKDARKAARGKKKAKALLSDAGLEAAWQLADTPDAERADWKYEECTIADIVGTSIRNGRLSEPQVKFLRSLFERIGKRAQIEAKRAEENAKAEPVPEGRHEIGGEVISVRSKETQFGVVRKMVVKEDRGFRIYVTVPQSIEADVERGSRVTLTAKLERSRDDDKFGFGSRPTGASVEAKERQ